MVNMYPATKAVIERDGKILIIHRTDKEDCFKDEWDIPGGGIKFGETPEESIKREIMEESCLEVDIIRPLRIWTFFKNNNQTQVVGVTLLCKYISGNVKLSDEHNDFKWIDPSDIDNYKIHEGIKKDVRAGLN